MHIYFSVCSRKIIKEMNSVVVWKTGTKESRKFHGFLEWKELHSNSHPWEQLPQNLAQARELGSTCSELSEDVGSFLRKLHGRFGGRRIRNRYGEGGLQAFRAQSSLILICSSMVKICQLLIELGGKSEKLCSNVRRKHRQCLRFF